MTDQAKLPPLAPLHLEASLSSPKLSKMRALSTEDLLASLLPGLRDSLKTRPDGTILDGHHRVHVLRERGVDVDSLPRDIIQKEQV